MSNPHHEVEFKPLYYRYWTPTVFVILLIAIIGWGFLFTRFFFGLGSITNLSNQFGWGMWIGVDVATGVALAAGGFTTAFIAHIWGRHEYEAITRAGTLSAMLGYTFVALGVVVDLGQYYYIWHVPLPWWWQGNSALFEVGMCVILYLTVLYIEFVPIIVEHFKGKVNFPAFIDWLNKPVEWVLWALDVTIVRIMWIFLIAGVVLSCAHQSSLGTVMALMPTKLHPLWWSRALPAFFLASAIAVGFPMVMFEGFIEARSFKLRPEMHIYKRLARYTPWLIGFYLLMRFADLTARGAWGYIIEGSLQSNMFIVEILIFLIALVMFASPNVRANPRPLFIACCFAILGVIVNRVDTYLIGYTPLFMDQRYYPAIGEIFVTAGLVSTLILIYRFLVIYVPILPTEHKPSAPPEPVPVPAPAGGGGR
jgi:Ni/Fe-hydrogenase subunit HybB-like protein